MSSDRRPMSRAKKTVLGVVAAIVVVVVGFTTVWAYKVVRSTRREPAIKARIAEFSSDNREFLESRYPGSFQGAGPAVRYSGYPIPEDSRDLGRDWFMDGYYEFAELPAERVDRVARELMAHLESRGGWDCQERDRDPGYYCSLDDDLGHWGMPISAYGLGNGLAVISYSISSPEAG